MEKEANKNQNRYDLYDHAFSPGYHKLSQFEEIVEWYDERPFNLAVWPNIFSIRTRKGDWWLNRIKYLSINVELILEGEVNYIFGGHKLTLTAGDVFLTHPGDDLSISNGRTAKSRIIQLVYSGAFSNQVCNALGLHGFYKFSGDNSEIKKLLLKCRNMMMRKGAGDAAENSAAGYRILALLAARCSNIDSRDFDPDLSRAIYYINSHLAELNVSDLAFQTNLSRSTLNRLFRRYCGCTPLEYRNRQRLEQAKHLVLNTRLTFKEISDSLGYCTPAYFSSIFRKNTGMTLSQFRRSKLRDEV